MNYISTDLRKNEIEFVLFKLKRTCAKLVFSIDMQLDSAVESKSENARLLDEYYCHQARAGETTARASRDLGALKGAR